MSVRGGVAKQHSSCHRRCRDCHSVTHVAVPVPYDPQEVEAESKQGCAQQVPQGCQVGDGKTVRVFAAPPHGMHHPVCYTQQQQHLEEKEKRWLVCNIFSRFAWYRYLPTGPCEDTETKWKVQVVSGTTLIILSSSTVWTYVQNGSTGRRSGGEVGNFYLQLKDNKDVCCDLGGHFSLVLHVVLQNLSCVKYRGTIPHVCGGVQTT